MTTLPDGEENEVLPLYLAQFDRRATSLFLSDGTQHAIGLAGEILVAGQSDTDGRLIVHQIRRLSVWTDVIDELKGLLSLAGPDNRLDFAPAPMHDLAPFDVRIYYPALSEQEPACAEDDAMYPSLETLRGKLAWESLPAQQPDRRTAEVRITLVLDQLLVAVKNAGTIQALVFETPDQPLQFRLLEETPPDIRPANSLQTCVGNPPGVAAGNSHERRVLNLRFVSLSAVGLAAVQIEQIAQAQLNGACAVWWMKGGVRLAPQPNIVFPANGLGGQVAFGQYSLLPTIDNDQNAVEVFLVDNLTDGNSRPIGGVTQNCYTQGAYIILALGEAIHNDFLLAHEIGHVLGLRHPGQGAPPASASCQSITEGAPCSVMVPDSPDSSRNPLSNLLVIEQPNNPLGPLFTSLQQLGGWSPDQPQGFFHIVRDFPYDDGAEPSNPLPHFAALWSHSDVWNSNKGISPFDPELYDDNTTHLFGPDFAPNHSNPTSAGPNRMFVRLHTCQPLNSPVDVHLFLAIPGASSAPLANLTTGGPLAFANATNSLPSPGRYPVGAKVRSLTWAVPAGYPSHCCVFAVADSLAVPANAPVKQQLVQTLANIGASNYWGLASILAASNDVAQRNLHIEGIPKKMGRSLWLPWFVIGNPFETPAAAHLQMMVPPVPELRSLALEINDVIYQTWEPGELTTIAIDDRLPTGVDIIARIGVRLSDELPEDLALPIDISIIVGEQHIAGYRYILAVAPLEEIVAGMLDKLSGALRDVGVAFAMEEAESLVGSVHRITTRYRASPSQALTSLRRQSRKLALIARRLNSVETLEAQAAQRRLQELIGLLMMWEPDLEPTPFVMRINELSDRIQERVGYIVRMA